MTFTLLLHGAAVWSERESINVHRQQNDNDGYLLPRLRVHTQWDQNPIYEKHMKSDRGGRESGSVVKRMYINVPAEQGT